MSCVQSGRDYHSKKRYLLILPLRPPKKKAWDSLGTFFS